MCVSRKSKKKKKRTHPNSGTAALRVADRVHMQPTVKPFIHRGLRIAAVGAIILSVAVEFSHAASSENSMHKVEGLSHRAVEKAVYLLVDNLIRTVVFLSLSGVFAGLTIGIMCMDTLTLDIIADSGPEPDKTYASQILPLRRQGHLTLCTLILSNMLLNVLVVQEIGTIMDIVHRLETYGIIHSTVKSGGALSSFIVSTIVILIFTEIVPMSICKSKYSLRIAAAGCTLVNVAIVLMYPVALPLGALLDCIVPHDVGQIYDRRELRKLMILHCEAHGDRSGLATSELQLLIGAMDFHEKKVMDIMTPIEDTTTVRADEEITFDLIFRLWSSGRSRVPVLVPPNTYSSVLLVKDLLTATEAGARTIDDLVKAKSRPFATVSLNTSLPSVLRFFQQERTHMLLVFHDDTLHEENEGENQKDECSKAEEGEIHLYHDCKSRQSVKDASRIVGVVTLEDIVEELIKDEIYDEYDNYTATSRDALCGSVPNTSLAEAVAVPVGVREAVPPPIEEPEQPPRVNFFSYFLHPNEDLPLTDAQVWAVAYFLTRAVRSFFLWHPGYVKMLLDECGDEQMLPPTISCGESMGNLHSELSASNIPVPTTPVVWTPLSASVAPTRAGTFGLNLCGGHNSFLAKAAEERFVLYREGVETTHFTLVLGGSVDVLIGSEAFPARVHTFHHFAEESLTTASYTPDFSAVVLSGARLYRISKKFYQKYAFLNSTHNGLRDRMDITTGRNPGEEYRPTIRSTRAMLQRMQKSKAARLRTRPRSMTDIEAISEHKGLLEESESMYGTFEREKRR